jgi:hypothetical protein
MRKQSDEDLRDDAATDWTEAVARLPHVCFAEQAVPQWCLATPSSFGRADFVFCQRSLAHAASDMLARREPDSIATLEVSHGKRVEFFNLT